MERLVRCSLLKSFHLFLQTRNGFSQQLDSENVPEYLLWSTVSYHVASKLIDDFGNLRLLLFGKGRDSKIDFLVQVA